MKVVALVSGGKDSCYAMMKCIQYNHEIVALANLMPVDDEVDELDSYMYQTVGHQIIVGYAECMGIPLFRRRIRGTTRHQNLGYKMTPGDEVEDMFILLSEVKRQIPSVKAVSSGAIASDYQRLRVESVCSRLGLVSLAYLWKQDQLVLLQEMITNGIVAILVKVAAIGLDPTKHLGKDLVVLSPHLHKLKELYGINVCGEGGEYETLTLDCPLFINAHIVLDDFRIVFHSADTIAPVGVIHPVAFHLVNKAETTSSSGSIMMGNAPGKNSSVHEVAVDSSEGCNVLQQSATISDVPAIKQDRLQLSLTKQDDVFCMRCWLKGSGSASTDLQEDLERVLQKVESELAKCCLSWENVLYIHLYISDMNEFAMANEAYVRYITQEKCRFGVPSRSTVELPLSQAGLGRAYIEIVVANDHEKRVLHVQSISCWAPSCIGPYSQATLHNKILYMAGQLGLDPPTMTLHSGGASAELELALENSEAVAKCFNCSISTSTILFVIYCSKNIPSIEMIKLQEKQDSLLKKMRMNNVSKGSKSEVLDPVVLYILVPDLPKRALVEVKPLLYVMENEEMATDKTQKSHTVIEKHWGFQQEGWHNSCIQKCVVQGSICMVLLSVTNEIAAKICSESLVSDQSYQTFQDSAMLLQMQKVARFCIYLLDKVLAENDFSWDRTTTLRFYFPITLGIPFEALSHAFSIAFEELAKMGKRISLGEEPVFNLVPVLAAGKTTKSMEDLITCELFTRSS